MTRVLHAVASRYRSRANGRLDAQTSNFGGMGLADGGVAPGKGVGLGIEVMKRFTLLFGHLYESLQSISGAMGCCQ